MWLKYTNDIVKLGLTFYHNYDVKIINVIKKNKSDKQEENVNKYHLSDNKMLKDSRTNKIQH